MIKNRKRGCMYGLAIGDALGAAVEFRDPGTFPLVTKYRGHGPHGLDPGQWTDDTSMALALADSIAVDGWDLKSQLDNYVAWYETGKYSVNGHCFDIGTTTRSALWEYTDSKNTKLISSDDPDCSGNGSIMRLAPVPIKYCDDANLERYLVESSHTTHASLQCLSGCLVLGIILAGLIKGKTKQQALDSNFGALDKLVDKVAKGSYKNPTELKGSGWVVKSLEAALWAFYTSNSFEETVLKAVNLGDDADTTGAVAGQIAGAYYGYDQIPQSLIDGLDKKDMIDLYLNPILGV